MCILSKIGAVLSGARGIVDFAMKRYGEGKRVSTFFTRAIDCFFSCQEKLHEQFQLLKLVSKYIWKRKHL